MGLDTEILVIGAGIHGAGVAQAAAAAGFNVTVLEKDFIASGTSCKSSKLIHGGLRYLESGQFSLVRECLRERRFLLNNAPHLVTLKPFYIPVFRNSSRSAWKIQIGLNLYALLNGPHKSGMFKKLAPTQWASLDGLATKGLDCVFQYWDAQTNDARLTQAVMKSACDLGANLMEKSRVTSMSFEDNQWRVNFQNDEGAHQINSQIVINAAGPWANQVLSKINPHPEHMAVDLVQGTHVLINESMEKGIYYIEAPSDKRALFVMPREGKTLLGTTEKIYSGDPDSVKPTNEEINYLLKSVSHYFPRFSKYHAGNIDDSFAGLRVLPSQTGSAFSRPRETTLFEDKRTAPGLITIYGGKLTAYRATAEELIAKILPRMPKRIAIANTRSLALPAVD